MKKAILLLLLVFSLGCIVTYAAFKTILAPVKENPDSIQQTDTPEMAISRFFSLINQNKYSQAAEMLSISIVPNKETQEQWIKNLSAIKQVSIKQITMKNSKQYEVKLDIKVDENTKDAVIPYYGWFDGENIRFISIDKDQNNVYKIRNLATGM